MLKTSEKSETEDLWGDYLRITQRPD